MKVCCIVSSLGAGGAERVMTLLANKWASRGWDVSLVTLEALGADAYQLDGRIRRVALDLEKVSRSWVQAVEHNVAKIRGLRRTIVSLAPDVVISFVDKANVVTLLSCIGLKVSVVVSERVHPEHHKIGAMWSGLRRLVYPHADALVLQSGATRAWAQRVGARDRTHVIPNPVGDQFSVGDREAQVGRNPTVLAVGRLVPQKGFDLLIRSFSAVVQRHRSWSLVIVGEGPQEDELRALAATLLPKGVVEFVGIVKDPERYYRAARIVVVPSRFEGFPNALVEAMACGCAVIAANCPGGTGEIVDHDVDGILVPPENVGALAMALDELMGDGEERGRLAAGAVETASRFRLDRVMPLWDDVLSQVRRGR